MHRIEQRIEVVLGDVLENSVVTSKDDRSAFKKVERQNRFRIIVIIFVALVIIVFTVIHVVTVVNVVKNIVTVCGP